MYAQDLQARTSTGSGTRCQQVCCASRFPPSDAIRLRALSWKPVWNCVDTATSTVATSGAGRASASSSTLAGKKTSKGKLEVSTYRPRSKGKLAVSKALGSHAISKVAHGCLEKAGVRQVVGARVHESGTTLGGGGTRHPPLFRKASMHQLQKSLSHLPRADCALAAGCQVMCRGDLAGKRTRAQNSRRRETETGNRDRWLAQSSSRTMLYTMMSKS
jgi:hypothetical protein